MMIGEGLGTFLITFAGCGAIMIDALGAGGIGHLGVSLVFGLSYAMAILVLADFCRCHFNPALSIGFAVFGKVPVDQSAAAVGAQIIGAFVAIGLLYAILGDAVALGTSFPVAEIAQVIDGNPVLMAMACETVIAAILMFVALSVARQGRLSGATASLGIGATVAILTLVAGPLDGAPMNPARALAPAVMAGIHDGLWIYLLMPVIGGLIGGGIRVLVDKVTKPE